MMRPGPDTARYVPVCPLAEGGMGSVTLVARQEGVFARLYVAKRLLPQWEHDPSLRAHLEEEARVAGLIRHPNVVSVLDIVQEQDGVYLVMDYVEGHPLHAIVRAALERGEYIPFQVAASFIEQAARGLHAAHEQTDLLGHRLDLVHRDVSPQNILVDLRGNALVTDFGVARARGRARSNETEEGVLKGKLGYMAPETLRFEETDRRVDIFALGVVFYEVLSNRRLYRGSNVELGRAILHEPAPDIGDIRADIPPRAVDLLFRMLAKDPAARPATAQVVADELRDLVQAAAIDEGAVDRAEWVAEWVDDGPLTERRRLAAERLAEDGRSASSAEPFMEATTSTGGAPTTPAPADAASPRGRRLALLVLAAILTAGLLLFVGMQVGGSDEPTGGAEPPNATQAPRAEPSDEPERLPIHPVSMEAPATPEEPTAATMTAMTMAAMTAPEPTAPTTPRMRPSRRRGRMGSRMREAAAGSGDPFRPVGTF